MSLCSDHGNHEICRGKRCSDRYDSSESSDSGVVTSVSEDTFSTSNSDLIDLDSPHTVYEDSFTLSQDMAPNQGIDKLETRRNKMSWSENSDPVFLNLDDDFCSLAQYFTDLLSKDVTKQDYSFSNDSDFIKCLNCSSNKNDSGISTEETSESSCSSQRLSSEHNEPCCKSQSTCSTPQPGSPCNIRFPATRKCLLNNIYGPPKAYVCKWKDCKTKFSIVSHLVHHVQTIHVVTQRHLGHFTCLWENCRHYGISYNCAPSWPDHHVLTHTGKTFECFIPGCKRVFKTEVLQRRHITHHLDSISSQSSNNQSKYRDSPVAKSTRKINKKLKQRRTPYSANRPDFFDKSVMENLSKRLQIFEQCSQGIIEYNCDMSISVCLQNKVVASRTLMNGTREKLVRYYPPFIVDEEWIPMNSEIEKYKKIAWSLVSDTGKFYLIKFLNNRQTLIQEKCSNRVTESKWTSPINKTDMKKVLHQYERNNSVPSNRNIVVKRSSRVKSARKSK